MPDPPLHGLDENEIGEVGAAALSESLKSNATLTSLELVARNLLCASSPVSPRLSLTLLSSLQPVEQ
jgi:hypothetical protein